MVVIDLPDDDVKRLMEQVDLDRGSELTVDLEGSRSPHPDGTAIPFDFDETTPHRLLHGLDDIGLTLQHEDEIATYESSRGIA